MNERNEVMITVVGIRSSTPMLLGGYDSKYRHVIRDHGSVIVIKEPLRTQSLKGVMRWWFRALVAGILYYNGYDDEMIKDKIRSISCEYMGSVRNATPFILASTVFKQSLVNVLRHPRLNLMRITNPQDYAVNIVNAKITIRNDLYNPDKYYATAIETLLLTLFLGGLGKASRRGLGCFDITKLESTTHLDLKKYLENPYQTIVEFIEDVSRNLAYRIGLHAIKWNKNKDITPSILSPLPALASGAFRLYRTRIPNDMNPVELSIEFTKALNHSVRRSTLNGIDPIREQHIDWILGLPRGQRYPVSRFKRRASPLILSVHRGYAFLSVFLSLDWPDSIFDTKEPEARTRGILKAIDIALDTIFHVLEKRMNIVFERVI